MKQRRQSREEKVVKSALKIQSQLGIASFLKKINPISFPRENEITKAVLKFYGNGLSTICNCKRGRFLLHEDFGHETMKTMKPRYKLNSGLTFTRLSKKLYASEKDRISKLLTKELDGEDIVTAKSFSFCTDIWTSVANDCNISFAFSYISSSWELTSITLEIKPLNGA